MGTLSDLLSLAHERAENLGLPYPGAPTPADTWQVTTAVTVAGVPTGTANAAVSTEIESPEQRKPSVASTRAPALTPAWCALSADRSRLAARSRPHRHKRLRTGWRVAIRRPNR